MRYIFILASMLFLTHNVYASCIGGTAFVGKNGHTYCLSDKEMNWWSVFQWCEAQGLKFATPSELCDNGEQVWQISDGTCYNIKGIGLGQLWAVLNMKVSQTKVYDINLSWGWRNGSYPSVTDALRIVCY